MLTTTSMGLTEWDQLTDSFNHAQLASNWTLIDNHDHSFGKGVLIGSAGLAPNSVTTAAIASGAVGFSQLVRGAGGFAFSAVATGTTAQNGFLYYVTAGATITLPAPTNNAFVAVVNGDSALVTVVTGSGLITGPGIMGAGASSITLTKTSHVQCIADGSNWHIVGGALDTAWVNLTFQNGYSAGSPPPAARQIGPAVYMRGNVVIPGGAGTDSIFANLPAGIVVPPVGHRFASNLVTSADVYNPASVLVDTSGNFTIRSTAANLTNSQVISLAGFSYFVTTL